MISKVDSNPEMIYVGSDFKKVGRAIELNRERVELTSQTITRADREHITDRIASIDDDNKVDDSEKATLVREMARMENEFSLIRNEARDYDLGDSYEWENLVEKYEQIHALMEKIINTVGVYEDSDVHDLDPYYKQYLDAYDALQTLIFAVNTQSNAKVVVDIQPQVVSAKNPTVVTLILDNNGVDDTSKVLAENVTFSLSGLSSEFTTSMVVIDTTLYPDAEVEAGTGNTAFVTGCKAFTLLYGALSDDGVSVNAVVRIDTDSIQL